jgi:predicted transcriptional regulator
MHAEHAELIAALRAENHELTRKVGELSQLQSIIDAQDVLMNKAQRTLVEQGKLIDMQKEALFQLRAQLQEALRCP